MSNTSTEFAHVNIGRALNCLDRAANFAGIGRTSPEYLIGNITSYHAEGVDDNVRIEVEYVDGVEGEFPLLKITAERWELDK